MPCSCTLPGFSITCSNHCWLRGLPTRHRPAAPPSLTGLPQACLGSQRGAAGEAGCRRSQPRGLRGKAGEGKPSFLPHGHLILQPWIRGCTGGLQDWLRGQGQGSLVLCPHYPWYHLDTSTSATSTHSTLVGGDTTPQSDASPGLSAPMAGQKRGRLQAANPQLGLVVPVTSAKPLLGRCHPPVVTQGLKAHAVPAAASPAR